MSQIAFPVAETRVTARTRICCDRCKKEVPFERESYLELLKGWICAHKLIADHGGAQLLPAFKSVTEPPVTLPIPDELHLCPECWTVIEKLAQPEAA